MHLLLPGLSANDYLEVYTKSFDTVTQNSVKIGVSSLFLEKIAASRTIFSATVQDWSRVPTSIQTPPLLCNGPRKSLIPVSHTAIPQTVTTSLSPIAGKYLVYINIPLYLTTANDRCSPQVIPKLDGVQVSGGFASQGYLRNADSTTKSSTLGGLGANCFCKQSSHF